VTLEELVAVTAALKLAYPAAFCLQNPYPGTDFASSNDSCAPLAWRFSGRWWTAEAQAKSG